MNTQDLMTIGGRFDVVCIDGPTGKTLWHETIKNLVVTVGRDQMLDAALSGSSYTVTGPYMGLISSVGYTAINLTDTLASHPGWLEAGGANAPTYTAPRPTITWSPAANSIKSLASPASFTMTGGGTVQGIFIAYGAGASSVIGSTTGTLFNAAALNTPQPVLNTNILLVSYSVSL